MTVVVAHAGHWLVQLLYVAPVIFIAAVILREKLRERRAERSVQTRDPDPSSRD